MVCTACLPKAEKTTQIYKKEGIDDKPRDSVSNISW